MSVGEITTQLELNQLKTELKWHVEGCSMKTDEGFKSFQSGLEWIKSSFLIVVVVLNKIRTYFHFTMSHFSVKMAILNDQDVS